MTARALFRRWLGISFGALLVLSAVAFLYYARSLFFLFGAAVALAAAARLVANGFMRLGCGRGTGTALAYLTGVLIAAVFTDVMLGLSWSEVGPAGGRLLRGYEQLTAQLTDGGRLSQLLASILPRPDATGVLSHLLPANDGGATAFTITSVTLEVVISV